MGLGWFFAVVGGAIIWGGVTLRDGKHPDLGGWVIFLGWIVTTVLVFVSGWSHGEREDARACKLCGKPLTVNEMAAESKKSGLVHRTCYGIEWNRLRDSQIDPVEVMGPEKPEVTTRGLHQ